MYDSSNPGAFPLNTSLWHPSDASNLPEAVTHNGIPPKKLPIVNVSKVIERLSFASKTVQSCVHLSQRRHKLRKYILWDFVWLAPLGVEIQKTQMLMSSPWLLMPFLVSHADSLQAYQSSLRQSKELQWGQHEPNLISCTKTTSYLPCSLWPELWKASKQRKQ